MGDMKPRSFMENFLSSQQSGWASGSSCALLYVLVLNLENRCCGASAAGLCHSPRASTSPAQIMGKGQSVLDSSGY